MKSVLVGILCVAVPATTAFAHGGYYQGPKTPDGMPLPTGGPPTGGTPFGGGPTTGGGTFGPAVTGRDEASCAPRANAEQPTVDGLGDQRGGAEHARHHRGDRRRARSLGPDRAPSRGRGA